MRLIDADAIENDWFEFHQPTEEEAAEGCMATFRVLLDRKRIDNAPTIDAVPVVRCKDCKWFDKQRRVCHDPRYGDGYANYQPPNTNDEYWCADGERKDEEADK